MYIKEKHSNQLESPYVELLTYDPGQYPDIPDNLFITMDSWDEDTAFAKTSYILWASHYEYVITGQILDNTYNSNIQTEDAVDLLLLIASKTVQKINASR
jgi:hypothetical protein